MIFEYVNNLLFDAYKINENCMYEIVGEQLVNWGGDFDQSLSAKCLSVRQLICNVRLNCV